MQSRGNGSKLCACTGCSFDQELVWGYLGDPKYPSSSPSSSPTNSPTLQPTSNPTSSPTSSSPSFSPSHSPTNSPITSYVYLLRTGIPGLFHFYFDHISADDLSPVFHLSESLHDGLFSLVGVGECVDEYGSAYSNILISVPYRLLLPRRRVVVHHASQLLTRPVLLDSQSQM